MNSQCVKMAFFFFLIEMHYFLHIEMDYEIMQYAVFPICNYRKSTVVISCITINTVFTSLSRFCQPLGLGYYITSQLPIS